MESAKNLQETQYEGHLIVAPNEKLPWNKIIFLGLQHVLAMDVYVVPFVIASILSLGVAEASILIQATFLYALTDRARPELCADRSYCRDNNGRRRRIFRAE